jgi:hypothetical protein
MRKPGKQKLWQVLCCLLSVVVALRITAGVEATEFSGGRITGPLLTMANIGILLFVLGLLVTFAYPRVAASIGLAASLLCLPLYFYFTAPGPFRRILRGEYSVPLQASFVWNPWTIAGVLALSGTAYVCCRGFRVISRGKV